MRTTCKNCGKDIELLPYLGQWQHVDSYYACNRGRPCPEPQKYAEPFEPGQVISEVA